MPCSPQSISQCSPPYRLLSHSHLTLSLHEPWLPQSTPSQWSISHCDPVYRTLESHRLEHLFERLQQMGVRRVEDLEQLTQADLGELKVTKFDRAKFMATFITQTPHHGTPSGSADKPAGEAAVSGIGFEGGKHVMFSYQWDCQSEVQAVREHFAKLGIPTWMDTDGGMQVDIYDSMAEGVSDAACLVCFMTQAYQDSANCALELKFAKQSGVPIVCVMMEAPDSSDRAQERAPTHRARLVAPSALA